MSDNNEMEPPLLDDGYCFGCGPNNPIGLHLTFAWDETTGDYVTSYTPTREHQGWVGRIHGGLTAVVFDEVLSRVVLYTRDMKWVTAELTTRMIRPIVIGEPLEFRARIVMSRSRLTISEGEAISKRDGVVVATGRAKMMPVPADQVDSWMPSRTGSGTAVQGIMTVEGKPMTDNRTNTNSGSAGAPEREGIERATPIELASVQEPDTEAESGEDTLSEPLIKVFDAGTYAEGQIIRGLLETEGIPAVFEAASDMPIAYLGVQIQGAVKVAPEHEARALDLIAAYSDQSSE
ncbi:MAG: PaaI family thioesterase [Capsulimonadaceae bacterium]|nr:PaaI family thioesterase [Capsulimonadaceae bacterium]